MLFGRRIRVTIEVDGKQKVYEHSMQEKSLAMRFDIQKKLDAEENANVEITGLPMQDIQKLSTSFDYKTGKVAPNFLAVEAGYEEEFGLIFKGAITSAVPTLDSPDIGLKLQAIGGYYAITQRCSVSIKQAKLSDIAKSIAEGYGGVMLDFQATDREVGDYTWRGTVQAQFANFTKSYRVKAWLENGVLYVGDKDKPKKNAGILLDNESGLIGHPTPTAEGASILSLLRPGFTLRQKIDCKFEKLPMLNASYEIRALQHTGGNYLRDFYTKIEGLKSD